MTTSEAVIFIRFEKSVVLVSIKC